MTTRSMDFLSKYFECILDALPDGVFVSDVSGITLRVNRMYEQLTGLTQEQVQGKQVRALVENGVFDKVLNPEIVRTGKPATHVQQLQNGKKLVLSGFPVFDESGALRLVVTFVRDITMITRLNEQMEEQRHLIDQFHEQMAYITQKSSKALTPVYESQAIQGVVNMLQTVAPTDASVLLLGETGVGKDVFARLTHGHSARKDKIFLKVDCGGISETLTESEMFGYMPGAFTGASSKGKAGYFELADGGTVFLDEIGELPLSMQTRLLRVLQDGEIMRVGGSRTTKVDVRIIAATNKNLSECVETGTFRRDLYYRLNVATVTIPALRERPDDVRPLVEHFLRYYAGKYGKSMAIMEVALSILSRYQWPGNVRELQNLVHGLVITHKGSLISLRDLPVHITEDKTRGRCYADEILTGGRALKNIMADIERDFLQQALEVHGSVQKVADLFQIDRSTIFRKIQKK
ncbi:sigma-54 interaction domain-containing protein [Desulfomicrobium baculatum]|uniref:PAS modulated sigma54 specific transcriptional regulator, Fis family n=1 Tax=Desulfomicrobium baculatum (strain DSM 4028 / VKM B-1378 / X) TaxID=525897 RepID=C7LUE3_DESBD|nr:sigma 54-interacting transcriptional regulator [Desulfomicrobium baculatum]ACU89678.1 PAS modulated sigma54 specific transcriptional regulator, Fis family [Desulfomicrobium baculatum DSM 4028]